MEDLGRALYNTGRKIDAETPMREAWEGRVQELGVDHLKTVAAAHDLGVLLLDLRRPEETFSWCLWRVMALHSFTCVFLNVSVVCHSFSMNIHGVYVVVERFTNANYRTIPRIVNEFIGLVMTWP